MLLAGSKPKARVELLLSLTKISSDNIKLSLVAHLCDGFSDSSAASLFDVPKSNFNRALNQLNQVATTVEAIKEIDWQKFYSEK